MSARESFTAAGGWLAIAVQGAIHLAGANSLPQGMFAVFVLWIGLRTAAGHYFDATHARRAA